MIEFTRGKKGRKRESRRDFVGERSARDSKLDTIEEGKIFI